MDNPEKLTTRRGNKNQNTAQHGLDTTMRKQSQRK